MSRLLTIAIADTSMIIRNGLTTLLRHLPGFRTQIIDIATIDTLHETLMLHQPDILIVNPSWIGCLSLQQMKETSKCLKMKCVALVYTIMDQSLLNQYDERITLYETSEELCEKLKRLCSLSTEVIVNEEQQTLSAREKEIVICVVKGMTNREIADQLFLSTHTVITHRRNIARKLQIRSASGLTVYAIVNKLVELNEVKL